MRTSAILLAFTIASCLALSVSAASKLNYHLIKSSDYSKISQLAAIRDYGVNLILKEAIAEKKLPNTTYHLVANNSIYNATNGTYVYYKFNLTYKDAKGDKVYPQFVVQYNKVTKAKKLQGKASASIKLANSTSSSGSKSTSNNTSSHSSNSSSSHASSTSSHSSNSSSAAHSTNNTSNYTKVPASHYNNSVIHKALMYGVNIVAKKAIADGHLPKSNYNVLAINSIYQEVLANSTNYKFDVDIQDVNKTFIADAIYTVHHNKASGANSVTKLAYRVLPHSSK